MYICGIEIFQISDIIKSLWLKKISLSFFLVLSGICVVYSTTSIPPKCRIHQKVHKQVCAYWNIQEYNYHNEKCTNKCWYIHFLYKQKIYYKKVKLQKYITAGLRTWKGGGVLYILKYLYSISTVEFCSSIKDEDFLRKHTYYWYNYSNINLALNFL